MIKHCQTYFKFVKSVIKVWYALKILANDKVSDKYLSLFVAGVLLQYMISAIRFYV